MITYTPKALNNIVKSKKDYQSEMRKLKILKMAASINRKNAMTKKIMEKKATC